MSPILAELSEPLRRLLLGALETAGSYDPKDVLYLVEEDLTSDEINQAQAFLAWCHATRRTFSRGNVEAWWAQWQEEVRTAAARAIARLCAEAPMIWGSGSRVIVPDTDADLYARVERELDRLQTTHAQSHAQRPGDASRSRMYRVFYAADGNDLARAFFDPPSGGGTVEQTHRPVAEIAGESLDDVFAKMQGDYWSPGGRHRDAVRALGMSHTSLSVGDVIQDEQGTCWFCAPLGWRELNDRVPATTRQSHHKEKS